MKSDNVTHWESLLQWTQWWCGFLQYILLQAIYDQNVIDTHTHLLVDRSDRSKHYENTGKFIFLDISCCGSGWSLVEWCIVTLLGGWGIYLGIGNISGHSCSSDDLVMMRLSPAIHQRWSTYLPSWNPFLQPISEEMDILGTSGNLSSWQLSDDSVFLRTLKCYIWYAWPSL